MFALVLAQALKEINAVLGQLGLVQSLSFDDGVGWLAHPRELNAQVAMQEVAYVDDIAFDLEVPQPSAIVDTLRALVVAVHGVLLRYGFRLNFSSGKTEAIISWRGAGTAPVRRLAEVD